MAATAWELYNASKELIGDGSIDLDTDQFYMALCQANSNASSLTLSTYGSLTNEVANGNGYVTGGKSASGIIWSVGTSAKARKFDGTATFWSASGGTIACVQWAVLYASAGAFGTTGQLLCKSKLSTAKIDVTATNRLTVTPNATQGYFEMV